MTRLGIDAFNLLADQRGMGRMVRRTLRVLQEFDRTQLTLVARGARDAPAIEREFGIAAVTAAELSSKRLDAVWYPWNGMRFAPHAPSVVTIHDPFAFTFPHHSLVARRREQGPIRRAIRSADAIFAVSRWTAEELERVLRAEPSRIRVVPNAIDSFWHPVASPIAQPYMLFVGGPERRKNAALLFDAYDRAFERTGPQLVIAGSLSERDESIAAQMRASHRRVRPDDEELRALYSGAVAVLVPSAAEGYGLTAVEAMACGAPVLASDAAALPETCAGAALLVQVRVEAWRDALQTIAGDAVLQRDLRSRGLARVQSIDPAGPASALLEFASRSNATAR